MARHHTNHPGGGIGGGAIGEKEGASARSLGRPQEADQIDQLSKALFVDEPRGTGGFGLARVACGPIRAASGSDSAKERPVKQVVWEDHRQGRFGRDFFAGGHTFDRALGNGPTKTLAGGGQTRRAAALRTPDHRPLRLDFSLGRRVRAWFGAAP